MASAIAKSRAVVITTRRNYGSSRFRRPVRAAPRNSRRDPCLDRPAAIAGVRQFAQCRARAFATPSRPDRVRISRRRRRFVDLEERAFHLVASIPDVRPIPPAPRLREGQRAVTVANAPSSDRNRAERLNRLQRFAELNLSSRAGGECRRERGTPPRSNLKVIDVRSLPRSQRDQTFSHCDQAVGVRSHRCGRSRSIISGGSGPASPRRCSLAHASAFRIPGITTRRPGSTRMNRSASSGIVDPVGHERLESRRRARRRARGSRARSRCSASRPRATCVSSSACRSAIPSSNGTRAMTATSELPAEREQLVLGRLVEDVVDHLHGVDEPRPQRLERRSPAPSG